MRYLIALGHPAHYHLFKNVAKGLVDHGHEVRFAIREKDVLKSLLDDDGITYSLLGNSTHGLIARKGMQYAVRLKDILSLVRDFKPDLMFGTNGEIAHAGFLTRSHNMLVTEDDQHVTPLYARTCFPFTNNVLAPDPCSLGRWENKGVKYPSYHELAYLHPNHFTPDPSIVKKYFDPETPYYLLRFVQLKAHHDKGIRGIHKELALKIVDVLKERGEVYISSERILEPELEPFRIKIAPVHMHHVLAYSQLFIGDSQTMAAEAGVLGTPFIRFNDFVGRIGYLNEIENIYRLGIGIPASNPEKLIETLNGLLSQENLKQNNMLRRKQMLSEKLDAAKFFIWLFSNYPESLKDWSRNRDGLTSFM